MSYILIFCSKTGNQCIFQESINEVTRGVGVQKNFGQPPKKSQKNPQKNLEKIFQNKSRTIFCRVSADELTSATSKNADSFLDDIGKNNSINQEY